MYICLPINCCMKNMNISVIRCRCHERVSAMILHSTQSFLVELQGLVRGRRKVQIKPDHATVVTADDEVIARRMDIDARQPLAAAQQLLDEFLLHEMINLDVLLGSHEEERTQWMEADRLHCSGGLGEGELGLALGQLMDANRRGASCGGQGRQIIALVMPHYTRDRCG